MNFINILNQLVDRIDLSEKEMTFVMSHIMEGKATDVQIASFLTALRTKGETVVELVAAVKLMRKLSVKVKTNQTDNLVDTVGCGDGSSTFNISTCCAFVCASLGLSVAKHGNRSNTSASGSSDMLAVAGVNLDLTPEQVAICIDQNSVGFLFAPKHHSAMRHAVTARKEMGLRTLFNLLGPLTNPAEVKNQVIGVFSDKWLKKLAEALQILGSHNVMVVHARDHLDEISTSALTDVVELKNGSIQEWTIDPKDYGTYHPTLDNIKIQDAKSSLLMVQNVLAGDNKVNQQATDIIALNAGAALYVGGMVGSFAEGVELTKKHLKTGLAFKNFQDFIKLTQSFAHSND